MTSELSPTSAQLTGDDLDGHANTDDRTLIVFSKLHPPARRRGTVERRALLRRLAADPESKLVLVVAPAGWGKTSLLGEWCASGAAKLTAWLSIDPADNDPVRFWAHVIAAVNKVSADIGAAALRLLTAPGVNAADALLP